MKLRICVGTKVSVDNYAQVLVGPTQERLEESISNEYGQDSEYAQDFPRTRLPIEDAANRFIGLSEYDGYELYVCGRSYGKPSIAQVSAQDVVKKLQQLIAEAEKE